MDYLSREGFRSDCRIGKGWGSTIGLQVFLSVGCMAVVQIGGIRPKFLTMI
jgi:hypothetical protein